MTLWGLLFTKCFLLEFLVRHYAVPINSLYYVWALSIIMATLATVVYVDLQYVDQGDSPWQSFSLFQLLASVFSVLLVFNALISPDEKSYIALTMAALIYTIKSAWNWLYKSRKNYQLKTLGWASATVVIIYLKCPTGFLIFSICILILSTMPSFSKFFMLKKSKV